MCTSKPGSEGLHAGPPLGPESSGVGQGDRKHHSTHDHWVLCCTGQIPAPAPPPPAQASCIRISRKRGKLPHPLLSCIIICKSLKEICFSFFQSGFSSKIPLTTKALGSPLRLLSTLCANKTRALFLGSCGPPRYKPWPAKPRTDSCLINSSVTTVQVAAYTAAHGSSAHSALTQRLLLK